MNMPNAFRTLTIFGVLSLALDARAEICFYENYNYSGASYCTGQLQGEILAPVIDKISAVKVPPGYKAILYQHPGFTGATLELQKNAPNLSDLAFNNKTSSFQIFTIGAETPVPKQILFIGNSFFHGNAEPTLHYNVANVTDLNGSGYGGVPGIFKQLTVEAKLSYAVSIEAVSGKSLQYHYENRLAQIGSKAWDVVVMADYSMLDSADPGNPAKLYKYSKLLEQYVHGSTNPHPNAAAEVYLMETWPRADQLYNTPGGHWANRTVEQMAENLRAAYAEAALQDQEIDGVVPVGDAFTRAITDGVADRNPYDGIDPGKVNVWNKDSFHASAWGSYLEACVLLGRLTGVDPRILGPSSIAAQGLGLTSTQAVAAQNVAARQLGLYTGG